MCSSSSQYEVNVTEVNYCEHGQTFTSDQTHGGLGQCVLFVLLIIHQNTEYCSSAEEHRLFSCGTARPW